MHCVSPFVVYHYKCSGTVPDRKARNGYTEEEAHGLHESGSLGNGQGIRTSERKGWHQSVLHGQRRKPTGRRYRPRFHHSHAGIRWNRERTGTGRSGSTAQVLSDGQGKVGHARQGSSQEHKRTGRKRNRPKAPSGRRSHGDGCQSVLRRSVQARHGGRKPESVRHPPIADTSGSPSGNAGAFCVPRFRGNRPVLCPGRARIIAV